MSLNVSNCLPETIIAQSPMMAQSLIETQGSGSLKIRTSGSYLRKYGNVRHAKYYVKLKGNDHWNLPRYIIADCLTV